MSNLASTRLLTLGLVNSLLWSLYLLLTRHVVSGARLDAWAYTLVQLLAAGLVLLWIGRRAAGSWSDLLAPWTVGYAFLRVAINGATAAAVAWLAITQSTLLATISVLIGALSGWLLTRRPIEADTLGGFAIAPRTDVLLSPYLVHRHPAHWDDPEAFRPQRFLPARPKPSAVDREVDPESMWATPAREPQAPK